MSIKVGDLVKIMDSGKSGYVTDIDGVSIYVEFAPASVDGIVTEERFLEKQERRIVQISAARDSNYHCTHTVALCDDGTVWSITDDNNVWIKFPDIPQRKG
jgi:hypothetical protein